MGVETIRALIEREASDEAERLIADARDAAAGAVRAAEEAAGEAVAEAYARAEPRLAGEASRRVNAARLRLLERRASIAAERLDAAYALAAARLDEIAGGGDPARWRAALERLVSEAVEITGPGSVIETRSRDRASLEPTAAANGAGLASVPDDGPAGVVVRSADRGREVDATLVARLGRARATRAEPVAAALGLDRTAEERA